MTRSFRHAGELRTPEGVERRRRAERERARRRHAAGELWSQQPENRLRIAIAKNQHEIRKRQETA